MKSSQQGRSPADRELAKDGTSPFPVPNGQSGEWFVGDVIVTKEEAAFHNLRCSINGRTWECVEPGHYKRLCRGSVVVMSNTPMEMLTHREIIRRASGNVLLNGLGLGMVLWEILKKPQVQSVTVIEKSHDVLKLVAPHFKDQRVQIINACAFKYKPRRGARFDAVWHDIWDDACPDNLSEMATLHRRYAKRTWWQGSWAQRSAGAY